MNVETFSPAAISSFFAPHIVKDPLKCGAWGGGFTISRGVQVNLEISFNAEKTTLENYINNVKVDSCILGKLVKLMLPPNLEPCRIVVKQKIQVPIECGFGTSGASALAIALALAKALKLNMTYLQIARAAHLADLKCKTGLGTVTGIIGGGFRIAVKPGAPGIGIVDRIPISTDDYYIIAAAYGPIPTKKVLSNPAKLQQIKKLGKETLRHIMKEPTPENFMKQCKKFAIKSGFMTGRVKKAIQEAEKAGAVGATQNMIGEAIHALTPKENLESVYNAFTKHFRRDKIVIAKIDIKGPIILSA